MNQPKLRALFSETLGTALLVSAILGSSVIVTAFFSDRSISHALGLVSNTFAIGTILIVLIELFRPISGAHFNPIVTLAMAITGRLTWELTFLYILAQGIGAILGIWLAQVMHADFFFSNASSLPSAELSRLARVLSDLSSLVGSPLRVHVGIGEWISEAISSFALLAVIFTALRRKTESRLPYTVALTVVTMNWFTSAGGFANPLITLALSATPETTVMLPADLPGVILSQVLGGILAVGFDRWVLTPQPKPAPLPE